MTKQFITYYKNTHLIKTFKETYNGKIILYSNFKKDGTHFTRYYENNKTFATYKYGRNNNLIIIDLHPYHPIWSDPDYVHNCVHGPTDGLNYLIEQQIIFDGI